MKVLLVGGAVRDKLLGLDVKDNDWVVVGGTPEYFLENKYKQVGADFPVFLHPETGDEYALARIERKTGVGYAGFETIFDPSVTIEEDLSRRDLTINAIAQYDNGELVDPFGGVSDLKNKVLKHVSSAFSEDPLRVLRVARFMARYSHLGFSVHPDTMTLMREMVEAGEVDHLVSERVFAEMDKSFDDPNPSKFFETLNDCGALKVVFPEIKALDGVPQPPEHHPEIDTFVHTMMVLEQARVIGDGDHSIMYAALVHDLGKAVTPKELWPKHHQHEDLGVSIAETMSDRLKAPAEYKRLGMLSSKFHLDCHRVLEKKKPLKVFEFIMKFDILRNDNLINKFVKVSKADARGRTGFEDKPYPQEDRVADLVAAIKSVKPKPLIDKGFKGKELGDQLNKSRLAAVSDYLSVLPEKMAVYKEQHSKVMANYISSSPEEKHELLQLLKVSSSTAVIDKLIDEICPEVKSAVHSDIAKFNSIDGVMMVENGFKNKEVGEELYKRRVDLLKVKKPQKRVFTRT